MNLLDHLKNEMVLTRRYTCELLERIDHDHWFTRPAGLQTHIAWQVGHLAMAQFRLCVFYIRPVTDADKAVISDAFIAHFRKGTTPTPEPADYPSVEQILRTFHDVHAYILGQWNDYAAMDLQADFHPPHRVAKRKIDMLSWVSRHEMLHAGQIGLISRQLGYASIW